VSDRPSPLIRLLRYMKGYRKRVALATLFSILNKLFDLAPPLLIGAAVDIVVRRDDSIFGSLGIEGLREQLYVLGAITLVIWVLESLFEYAYKIYWRNLAQEVEHNLRLDAYTHLQELEMEYFEDRQTGGLMAILNDDVNQLERFLDIGANDLIQVATTVIVICSIFLILAPDVAWMAVLPMPVILVFSVRFQRRLEPRYADVRQKVGILNGRLSNNLSGIATIKSYTAEGLEADRISSSSSDYRESNRRAIALSSAFTPIIRMVIVCGFIGMLVFGGIQTLDGEIEVAAYSVIIFLIQRLLWPLTRLGETFDQYQRAMASTTRALDLLDTPRRIVSGSTRVERVKGEIVLEKVSFGYRGRARTLDSLDLTIAPGENVAFVGATGAGKSTIVKLLLRFYEPNDGRILLDGMDIREVDLGDLRKAIGLVSQDTFLIDGTVRENIIYGRPDATMDEIVSAAKVAEIHDFIATLPQGYDTLVGEKGQKLSGGQRQRISIARAVLKDPPVLVLDEATSSVDNETEEAIQRSLERIIVGRTTIIIAHRLSTIRNVHRIFVLDDGNIVESGTHEELLVLGGQYSRLWKVQTGERNH
jgi:ATP-binding cassette subfamily B protein